MRRPPEFRPEEMKALIHWREWHITLRQSVAGAIGLALLVILASTGDVVENGFPYLVAAIAVIVLFPALALIHNWLSSSMPIAMDADGIFAPTLWGQRYVSWTRLHTIAHVHSIMGYSRAPIEFNLILFFKRGMPRRITLPELTGEEREQFFEVLNRISRLHRIGFVSDHTPEGQRALKRLPWLWI